MSGLLIVLARGVTAADLRVLPERGALEAAAGAVLPLAPTRGLWPEQTVVGDDLVATLRQMGLQVERRSAVLRPHWRGDDAALAMLARRPVGPADITLLELRDAATAAEQHGPHSRAHELARRRLAEHVRQARALLRRGEPPRTAVVALGPLPPVHVRVDPVTLLPRSLRRAARRHGAQSPAALLIDAPNGGHRQRLEAALSTDTFCRFGRLLTAAQATALGFEPATQRLHFVARPGVAFAPVQATQSVWPTTDLPSGGVWLPWEQHSLPVTLGDLAVHILMQAAILADRAPERRPVATALPDVAALLTRQAEAVAASLT
ncbi:MAG: hypothetical protein AAF628_22485 [Planctomycetota bacterium]